MKPILSLLLGWLIISSCSKEATIPTLSKQAVTIYYDRFDSVGKHTDGGVSVHWCSVSDSELKYYQSLPKEGTYCNTPGTISIRIRIGADTCSLK